MIQCLIFRRHFVLNAVRSIETGWGRGNQLNGDTTFGFCSANVDMMALGFNSMSSEIIQRACRIFKQQAKRHTCLPFMNSRRLCLPFSKPIPRSICAWPKLGHFEHGWGPFQRVDTCCRLQRGKVPVHAKSTSLKKAYSTAATLEREGIFLLAAPLRIHGADSNSTDPSSLSITPVI
jgi:hypothetical protein